MKLSYSTHLAQLSLTVSRISLVSPAQVARAHVLPRSLADGL